MKISIEERKAKGDRLNLRLVYYHGHFKDDSGKIIHQRERETLNLYLYGKPKTSIEKQHNKDTLKLAEAIKAKRIVEHESGKHGFKNRAASKSSFLKFFAQMMEQKKQDTSYSNYSIWESSYKQLMKYIAKPDLVLDEVTEDFASGFKSFLENKATTKTGQLLSKNTASSYFNKFRAVVYEVYRKGLITENPLHDVKPIKQQNNKREYLEIDETGYPLGASNYYMLWS